MLERCEAILAREHIYYLPISAREVIYLSPGGGEYCEMK